MGSQSTDAGRRKYKRPETEVLNHRRRNNSPWFFLCHMTHS